MGEQTPDNGTISFSTPKLIFGHVQSIRKPSRGTKRATAGPLFANGAGTRLARVTPRLPLEDNTPEGLKALVAANRHYREVPWPEPYNRTHHRIHLGDARDLSWIPDASVHLIVTSPPYWTLKEYAQGNEDQMGHFDNYDRFLSELDKVWRESRRVLVGGGRVCCVVGDVCIPRRKGGKHYLVPLHSDIQVRARKIGLDCLQPILWHKIANGVTEAEGNGAGFYGKPYQPGGIIKNDIEYILFLRKGGEYRSVPPLQKALSMLTREEMTLWQRSIWTDLRGASTRDGHPAPYPIELAERLIKLFSFAGDTILDPFAGTGSTSQAAIMAGRNSIANDIEPAYVEIARQRVLKTARQHRLVGATEAEVLIDGKGCATGVPAADRIPAAV
jgi:site-specific DNA-methyltransferase (adenine-specific)